jgi:hypothetical protein
MCFTKVSLSTGSLPMDNKQNPTKSPIAKKIPVQSGPAKPSAPPASVSSIPNISKPSSQPVMQSFSSPKSGVSGGKAVFVLILMLLLGVGVGYGASIVSAKTGTSIVPASLNPNAPQKGKTYGNGDTSVFKDTAEGVLKNGGIDGEGQYHLVRPGGDSQNVYVTSSSVDLSQFIDQKIKVWGETQSAQHAGWLMDVGKVQVE